MVFLLCKTFNAVALFPNISCWCKQLRLNKALGNQGKAEDELLESDVTKHEK